MTRTEKRTAIWFHRISWNRGRGLFSRYPALCMRLNAQIGGKMYSLLLVDDERLELETLRDYIAWDELGFDRVYTARGGRDGYDKALRLKPDVMITDIHMPVMNGIELAKQLYADGCTTKVIFLTGYDEFEYAKAALQVEAVDYILKPFSFEKIRKAAERVRELLHKEELLKMSVRVYGKKLLCRVIDNDGETGREACRQFLDVCEWDKEEWFGLITITAGLDDTVIEQVENSLSEVVYSIRGGVKGVPIFWSVTLWITGNPRSVYAPGWSSWACMPPWFSIRRSFRLNSFMVRSDIWKVCRSFFFMCRGAL